MGGAEALNEDFTLIIINILFSAKEYYIIWFDYESFLMDENQLLILYSPEDAQRYCVQKCNERTDIWALNFDEELISGYPTFLDKWNVIGDIANTLKIDFIGNHDEYTDLYSKFVYGSNIPALNTSGKKYVPTFTDEERRQIENLTHDMTRILKIALGLN